MFNAESQGRGTGALWPLSILGLSFWFLLAVPFANHNESYLWMAQFDRAGLLDVIRRPLPQVVTWRPIGVALAWLLYRCAEGSSSLVQALNYLIAATAWALLSVAVPGRRLFALAALLVGGAFFSGYMYLFHLHGVFYSPVLLQLALLFLSSRSPWGARTVLVTSALAAVLSFVHPFALLIQLAFMGGQLAERRAAVTRATWLAAGLAAVALVVLAEASAGAGALEGEQRLHGLVVSYRMIEVNPIVSAVALLLTAITLLGTHAGRRVHAGLWGVAALLAAVFLVAGIPLVILWVLACLVKAAIGGRWALAALLAATFGFPVFTATGSPTYGVFALMAGAAAVALDAPGLDERLASLLRPRLAAPLFALAVAAALALRSGAGVPLASRLIAPILAEREKTFQLQEVLAWLERSEYAGCGLVLGQPARPPSEGGNPLQRDRRPPTQQGYLDAWLASRSPRPCARGDAPRPVVYFGGETLADARLLHVVPGRYAGAAAVYLPPRPVAPP